MAKGDRGEYDPYRPLFTINVDKDALRGGLLRDHLEDLRRRVAEIQNQVPHLRVDEADLEARESEWRTQRTLAEYAKVLKRLFISAVRNFKTNSPYWQAYRKNPNAKKPWVGSYGDIEDVEAKFYDEPETVLEDLMEGRFTRDSAMKEAARGFHRKFAQPSAAKARPPFAYANRIDSPDTGEQLIAEVAKHRRETPRRNFSSFK
jgi:hypothetical protein